MSKREYMRGHYEECMGGGKVLPNVPKDLVIVGSEKGGIKRKTEEEGATPDAKKVKHEDEDVLKCFGCKHVYRYVFCQYLSFLKIRQKLIICAKYDAFLNLVK